MPKKGLLLFFLFLFIIIVGGYSYIQRRLTQLAPSPTIIESPTTIIGFNHIGLVVKDLDTMLDFYQRATSFELIKREKINQSSAANTLFNQDSISYEVAILKSPNMLLELTAFDNQIDTVLQKMPPQGPGMTHTCYQSAGGNSGYDKFVKAGVDLLSRGDQPIDLGGYGVTYAYAYDPEGNMLELEQMSNLVIRLKIGKSWADEKELWMTQVGILSPNIQRLTKFYQEVLEIEPYRVGTYSGNPAIAEIADLDDLAFQGAWFMLDGKEKKLELMQYEPPHATPNTTYKRTPTDLGYSYSFEVGDIQKEYQRLKLNGIIFLSEPQQLGEFWMVYANDIDGNVFSLREVIDSAYSAQNL